MDQLQQELEFGFSRKSKPSPVATRVTAFSPISITICFSPRQEQPPVTIPVDLTHASIPPPTHQQEQHLRSSLKKSLSTQNELDRIPSNRTYGLKINPNEHVIHYLEPYTPHRPLSSFTKRSIPDLPSMLTVDRPPSTIQPFESLGNQPKIHLTIPNASHLQIINQQQKKVTIQVADQIPLGRAPRYARARPTINDQPFCSSKPMQIPLKKAHFDEHLRIEDEPRKLSSNGRTNGRRSAPLVSQQHDLRLTRHSMYDHDDPASRNGHQRSQDGSLNRQFRTFVAPLMNAPRQRFLL